MWIQFYEIYFIIYTFFEIAVSSSFETISCLSLRCTIRLPVELAPFPHLYSLPHLLPFSSKILQILLSSPLSLNINIKHLILFKPRSSKITDYVRSHQPHPKHIQKRREEATLKWMLMTNQPLSTITNEAYKEKMAEFDPSFIVPGEKKIRTMIVKSYKYN